MSSPPRAARPGPTTLRRLYVTEDRPLDDLAERYRVGRPTVRGWLDAAGIPIRTRSAAGRRRQLDPPPRRTLAALATQCLSVPQIAGQLKVSPSTARRWLAEAGLTPPRSTLKNRPRGAATRARRPTCRELHQLYVERGLSVADTSAQLGVSTHLTRTWLLEDGIALRPPGGRHGATRPFRPIKPIPPAAELRHHRETCRLSLAALARYYGVTPETAARWLQAAGLPRRLPAPGNEVTDAELVTRYRRSGLSAAAIARQTAVRPERVLRALHSAGVAIDPGRQAGAARAAAAARRGTVASLPPEQAELAVQRYRDDGWSYQRVAASLDVSAARVRAELRRRGIAARRHAVTGPASRAARRQAPIEEVRRLYTETEWSAEEIAARLDVSGREVLRTGHAHGLPIRQGGRPAVPAAVALIAALYADPEISHVLTRHDVPRRPPGGDIADRFPEPVPLTSELLRELYLDAGCSSYQIELLTGQSQVVVRDAMHRHGIPFRAEHMSPVLRRLRADARADFLVAVAADYRACGSTRLLAETNGCSPATVRRWLAAAGVPIPGRGQWTRPISPSSPR